MVRKESCPVCQSQELDILFPKYSGKGVTSDHRVVTGIHIHNRLCRDCGLIFEADGIRFNADEFYRNSYRLMFRESETEVKFFSGQGARSQALMSVDVLLNTTELSEKGHYLEIGAGKGLTMAGFSEVRPCWDIHGLEPSQSYEFLKKTVTGARLKRCTYTEYQPRDGGYDCIAAYGVLEHVANPCHMLEWAQKSLARDGCLFIRVPNFSRNPNDLFTVDHLSKLTVASLQNLAIRAGLEVQDVITRGVSLFILMRRGEEDRIPENAYEENRAVAQINSSFAKRAIDTIARARQSAFNVGGRFAIFGLASSGLFAPFYLDFAVDEISAYLDENESMHGASIQGRPVVGLDGIELLGISDVALVISPVYHEQVKAKLESYGVKVHTPTIGEGKTK